MWTTLTKGNELQSEIAIDSRYPVHEFVGVIVSIRQKLQLMSASNCNGHFFFCYLYVLGFLKYF